MEELTLKNDSDYVVPCSYCGNKPESSCIIYTPFIPMQIVETDEEREARVKRIRAGKSFAKVKLSNRNPHYRCKRGEIIERDLLNNKVCLEIETWNTCTESGHMTWVAVMPSQYKKIWFDEDELENFESYDENGDLTK